MKKKVLWIMNEYNSTKTDMSAALVWWYGILENLGYEVYYYEYEKYDIEDLTKLVRDHQINFTIVAAYADIHTELIRLKPYTKVYVLQSDDRWRYANFSKFWIPFIDGVITFEGELNNYVSDRLKPENFHKMRWAFNPNTMAKVEKESGLIETQFLSHTGGLHGNRREMIGKFEHFGQPIFYKYTNTYEETKKIWSQSKFSVCFTQNSLNSGREMKGRLVEIPNWCVLVTEPFPDMEDYYDIENDIVVYTDVKEAIERMKFLDNNPEEYKRIFENGRKKLWEKNNAYIEWQKIMQEIDKDYKPIDIKKLLKEKHNYD